MDVYLQWVVDAWESVTEKIIEDSFKFCGLTTAFDGSEDTLIHCLKPNGPIPNGLQALIAKPVEQIAVDFEENVLIDPEQDEENGYVSDDGSIEL